MNPRRRRLARIRRREIQIVTDGPRCTVCGHILCPCCPTPWCDVLLDVPDDKLDDQECCRGACTIDPYELACWVRVELKGRREGRGFSSNIGWRRLPVQQAPQAIDRRAIAKVLAVDPKFVYWRVQARRWVFLHGLGPAEIVPDRILDAAGILRTARRAT